MDVNRGRKRKKNPTIMQAGVASRKKTKLISLHLLSSAFLNTVPAFWPPPNSFSAINRVPLARRMDIWSSISFYNAKIRNSAFGMKACLFFSCECSFIVRLALRETSSGLSHRLLLDQEKKKNKTDKTISAEVKEKRTRLDLNKPHLLHFHREYSRSRAFPVNIFWDFLNFND